MIGRAMQRLATPAALALAALAYFVPTLAGGAPVVYATCTTIAILAVMAYGADLILSYLGEVSLGHTIFWAAGGYAASMLAVNASWRAPVLLSTRSTWARSRSRPPSAVSREPSLCFVVSCFSSSPASCCLASASEASIAARSRSRAPSVSIR